MYNDDNKNIEIVSGNGKDLDISPVYDNLDIAKPRMNQTQKRMLLFQKKRNSRRNVRYFLIFCVFCDMIFLILERIYVL